MFDSLTPPTDNLYKFLAIGTLAFMLVGLVFGFQYQAQQRERYFDAQIELQAHGYVEGSGFPADVDLRRAYLRREAAKWEASSLMSLFQGIYGNLIVGSGFLSLFLFGCWWWRVQRHEDAILRATAVKLRHETNPPALATRK